MSQDELIDPFGDPAVRATAPLATPGLLARMGAVVFAGVVVVLVILRATCYG
jgi:hypothetical protein